MKGMVEKKARKNLQERMWKEERKTEENDFTWLNQKSFTIPRISMN